MRGKFLWPTTLTPAQRQMLIREIDDELHFHIEMRERDNQREGMGPATAHEDALRRFGDVDEIAEACVHAEANHPMRTVRRLLTTVLTLALGFGAVAFAFGLTYTTFLKPLRFTDADQLVRVGEGWDDALVPLDDFKTWREQSSSFEYLITFDATVYRGTDTPFSPYVRAMLISADYFETFDVSPKLGRVFASNELEEHAANVVLISEKLWISRYNRSSSTIGMTLELDGVDREIVGVMPAEAQLTHEVDVWAPLPFDSDQFARSYVIGRLEDGVLLENARTDIASLSEISSANVSSSPFYPLRDLYVRPVQSTLHFLLLAAVLVMLLIWAVTLRQAIYRANCHWEGTHASTLARPLESVGVALVAAVLGLAIAGLARLLVYESLLERWGTVFDQQMDGVVVLAVLVLAAITAMVLYYAPRIAIESGRVPVFVQRGLERSLSVSIVAVSVVLLVAFGHQARPFFDTSRTNLGFDQDGVVMMDLSLPPEVDNSTLYLSIAETVNALPSVVATSYAQAFPLLSDRLLTVQVDAKYAVDEERIPIQESVVDFIGPDYFQTMGIPVLGGRGVIVADSAMGSNVAIVNATFAESRWPNRNPIGRQIDIGLDGHLREVVGVVGDVNYFGGTTPSVGAVYIPFAQFNRPSAALIIKTTAQSEQLSVSVRNAVHTVLAHARVADAATVSTIRRASRSERTNLLILGLMVLGAIVCAVAGTTQLVSASISDRLSEIERCRASGTPSHTLLLRAWRPAFFAVSAGSALGLLAAYVLAKNILPDLFAGLAMETFAGAVVVAGILMLAATLFTARQALSIDPGQ